MGRTSSDTRLSGRLQGEPGLQQHDQQIQDVRQGLVNPVPTPGGLKLQEILRADKTLPPPVGG